MWKLAYNEKAVLIKTANGEYWYIPKDFNHHGCYNNQSKEYNASNALFAFEAQFGDATWKHDKISAL